MGQPTGKHLRQWAWAAWRSRGLGKFNYIITPTLGKGGPAEVTLGISLAFSHFPKSTQVRTAQAVLCGPW